jgi:transposase
LKEGIHSRKGRVLLIGVDSSKTKHDANFAINGQELVDNYKFAQNGKEYENIMNAINSLKEKESQDQVVLGIVSTSGYWKNFSELFNKIRSNSCNG